MNKTLGVFIISFIAIATSVPPLYWIVYHSTDATLVTAIVQAFIGMLYGVVGYWIGSSFTTSRNGLNAQPEKEKPDA